MEDIFTGLKFQDVQAGAFTFRFPLRYFDYSLMSAAFPVPVTRIRTILPSRKLKPVEIAQAVTTVVMIGTENRKIDSMSPYNEFDVMVPVTYQPDENSPGLPGIYPVYLPVTTEEALVGGVEIYGYPKFLAEITFEEMDESRRCRVHAGGADIVTLEVRKSSTEINSYDTYTYTVKDEHLLRTLLRVRGENSTRNIAGEASYILGDHPVATEIGALGIEKTSISQRYAPRLSQILYLPVESLPL